MLSMLVYFSSAQLAQSQAVAPPALLPLYSMLLCKNRKLFTVAGDNSHVLTPIPMHLIPIPIPFPSHGWSYSHSHGNPMGPMGSQSSPFACTPLLGRPCKWTDKALNYSLSKWWWWTMLVRISLHASAPVGRSVNCLLSATRWCTFAIFILGYRGRD